MNNEELPPLEFDGKFNGYGFFDPRAFWEKVEVMDRGRQTVGLGPTSEDRTCHSMRIERNSMKSE